MTNVYIVIVTLLTIILFLAAAFFHSTWVINQLNNNLDVMIGNNEARDIYIEALQGKIEYLKLRLKDYEETELD